MGILRWVGLYEPTRSANWPQIFPELIISGFRLTRMQSSSWVRLSIRTASMFLGHPIMLIIGTRG